MSVRVFLTHFKRDYNAMNEVYAGFFPEGARPTREVYVSWLSTEYLGMAAYMELGALNRLLREGGAPARRNCYDRRRGVIELAA